MDAFDVLALKPAFELDTNELEQRYRDLQKQLHPDKWLPLYSQVKFSDIAYKDALREGQRHDRIMEEILAMPGIEEKWESGEVEGKAIALLAGSA